MIVWWLGNVVLIVVVLPIAVVLLRNVLATVKSITPSVQGIAATAKSGSAHLDAVPLLLTTQQQVITTVSTVANYGGSLDVIVDDA